MSVRMNSNITKAFTTPIGYFRLPNSVELNRRLLAIIGVAETQAPSSRRSNIGGWRSSQDLLEWREAEIAILYGHIRDAATEMLRATMGPGGFSGNLVFHGWANVLRNGNYNTIHNHPESVWSGVYYVDAGSVIDDSLSGLLEFCDPRPFVEMTASPGAPFGRPLRIQPEPGLMVLFPSWLYHHVHPYVGDGARVSIAFNVALKPTAA
jgi:uncharacterized protein (TIGR02466 family)